MKGDRCLLPPHVVDEEKMMFGRPIGDLAEQAAIKWALGCQLKTSMTVKLLSITFVTRELSKPAITLLERNIISVMTLIEWSGMLSRERSAKLAL
jgi:hypothetical protein